jgi:uncharacterized coiled-coil protein SlyX
VAVQELEEKERRLTKLEQRLAGREKLLQEKSRQVCREERTVLYSRAYNSSYNSPFK